MSKELKALERINKEFLREDQRFGNMEHAREDYKILYKALTPPRAEDVCEALSEYFNIKISYLPLAKMFCYKGDKYLYITQSCEVNGVLQYSITTLLPPQLITLIGRFYEGLEVPLLYKEQPAYKSSVPQSVENPPKQNPTIPTHKPVKI